MSLLRATTLVGSVLTAVLTLGLVSVGASQAIDTGTGTDPSVRAPIPVPYLFFAGAAMAFGGPGAQLPGANDWSCRSTADKPRPVVLVHGTSGGAVTNWATYGPLLHNEGYCVYTLTYGALPDSLWPVDELGGLSDIMEVSVPQVGRFVDHVLESTGADQVDLVGHSQGTLVSALVAKTERPGRVHTVASIAPLWRGTSGSMTGQVATQVADGDPARAAGIVPSLAQMAPGSPMLEQLWTGGTPYAPGVHYLNIATRHDQVVRPFTSGMEPGPLTTNIVVQDGCEQDQAEHLAIVADPRTADFVLNALDPAVPREPRCEAVTPYVGLIPQAPSS